MVFLLRAQPFILWLFPLLFDEPGRPKTTPLCQMSICSGRSTAQQTRLQRVFIVLLAATSRSWLPLRKRQKAPRVVTMASTTPPPDGESQDVCLTRVRHCPMPPARLAARFYHNTSSRQKILNALLSPKLTFLNLLSSLEDCRVTVDQEARI